MNQLENKISKSNFGMNLKLYSFIKPGKRIFYGEVKNYEELKQELKKIKEIDGYKKPTFNIYPGCNGGIIIRFIREEKTEKKEKNVILEYIGLKFWDDFQEKVPEESKGKEFNLNFLEKVENYGNFVPYHLSKYKNNVKKVVDPYIVPGFNINNLENKKLIKNLEKLYKFIEKETGYKYKSFIPNKKGYTTFIPYEEVLKNPQNFSKVLSLEEYNKKILQILSQKEIFERLS